MTIEEHNSNTDNTPLEELYSNDSNNDSKRQEIAFIGAELCLGSRKVGTQFAPNTLLRGGIINKLRAININISEYGNVCVSDNLQPEFNPKMRNITQVADFNERLAQKVYNAVSENSIPMIVGGDHAIAIGSVSGVAKQFGHNLGVVWIDAHTDINTAESSPSGNIHGMPIAAMLGRVDKRLDDILFCGKKISGDKVLIIAARDIDPGERQIIAQENVKVLEMCQIKQKGFEYITQQVAQIIKSWGVNNIHLSIDIDSLDPKYVPGTGTPVEDGLTPEQLYRLIDTVTQNHRVKSVDVVELNPLLDDQNKTTEKITTDIIEYLAKKLN